MQIQLTKALPATHAKSVGLFTILSTWNEVFRQRQHLAKLDAAALQDLGLTQADVAAETGKPAWDVPSTWRRSC